MALHVYLIESVQYCGLVLPFLCFRCLFCARLLRYFLYYAKKWNGNKCEMRQKQRSNDEYDYDNNNKEYDYDDNNNNNITL